MSLHQTKQLPKDTMGPLKTRIFAILYLHKHSSFHLARETSGADTYSITIDSCNDRLLDPGDLVPVAQELAAVTVLECLVLHFLDVRSSLRQAEVRFQ